MKYYRISDSVDLNVIGKYPQIEDVKCDCDPIEDPLFIDNIGYKKINFTPKTPIGILNKGAKLTDFLTSPSIGYTKKIIVSDEFKNVLCQFGDENFQFFKSEIEITKNKKVYYWVLNPTNFNYNDIDFKNSEFFLIRDLFIKEEKLNVNSLEDFLTEKNRIEKLGFLYQFHIEKLFIEPKSKRDFIIVDNVKAGIGYYVSENIKKEITKRNLTGLEFIELN